MLMFNGLWNDTGAFVCDICGRKQDFENPKELPDGWSILVSRGNIVNICYDPDCKAAAKNALEHDIAIVPMSMKTAFKDDDEG